MKPNITWKKKGKNRMEREEKVARKKGMKEKGRRNQRGKKWGKVKGRTKDLKWKEGSKMWRDEGNNGNDKKEERNEGSNEEPRRIPAFSYWNTCWWTKIMRLRTKRLMYLAIVKYSDANKFSESSWNWERAVSWKQLWTWPLIPPPHPSSPR